MKDHINLGYIHDSNSNPVNEKQGYHDSSDTERVQLRRNLGLWSGISIIVGTIIGSGIWVTPGFIMTYSESVGIYMIQWAVCGVLSALGAMCYIELACVVPKSGGETVYLKEAFGDFVSFIFSWLRAVVLGPTSCAFLAGVSAKYILLIYPSIQEYLDETEIGFEWTYKIVGVGLMCKFILYIGSPSYPTLFSSVFINCQYVVIQGSCNSTGKISSYILYFVKPQRTFDI